jgi:hypothetical protein
VAASSKSAARAPPGVSEIEEREIIRDYRHQHAVVWLWLAARVGKFGAAQEILTPRLMRARDQTDAAAPHPRWPTATHRPSRRRPRYGTRIPRVSPEQPGPIHYPDLMLTFTQSRVAIELQITQPAPRKLETKIAAYGEDPRIEVIVYLTLNDQIANPLRAAAAQRGLSHTTRIHRAQWGQHTPMTIAD